GDLSRIGKPLEELFRRGVGIQADRVRIGANVRLAENTRGPVRRVVAFELLKEGRPNLGVLGDRGERDVAAFAFAPQTGAEGFFRHRRVRIRDGKSCSVHADRVSYARPANSRVSVWTRTFSPSLMNRGTRISSPVSSLATFVAAPAVSPRAPGSVDVTVSSTCGGNCRPIGLPLYFMIVTRTLSTRSRRSSPTRSARSVSVSKLSWSMK